MPLSRKLRGLIGLLAGFLLIPSIAYADINSAGGADYYRCLRYQIKIKSYPAYDENSVVASIKAIQQECPSPWLAAYQECKASGRETNDCQLELSTEAETAILSQQ